MAKKIVILNFTKNESNTVSNVFKTTNLERFFSHQLKLILKNRWQKTYNFHQLEILKLVFFWMICLEKKLETANIHSLNLSLHKPYIRVTSAWPKITTKQTKSLPICTKKRFFFFNTLWSLHGLVNPFPPNLAHWQMCFFFSFFFEGKNEWKLFSLNFI